MQPQHIHRAMQEAVGHHQAGRFADAEKIYRMVLQHDSRNAEAMQLLGLVEHQNGRHQAAVDLIRKAITIRPRPEFFVNLAQAERALGHVNEALDACQRAVQMAPNIPEAWNNLGALLKDLNRPAEAVTALERAISLRPTYAAALSNLGNARAQLDQAQEAEAALRRAISIDPNYAEAYTNLAHLLTRIGRLDEAVQLCSRAIQLKPNLVAAYANLGTALQLQGRLEEGNEIYRRGAALDPSHALMQQNLLGGFNHSTRASPQQSLEAHRTWAKRFAAPKAPPAPFTNDRDPNRRLRIGYVSPDLKCHSVAYFLEPILEHHDRNAFEITAYSNTESADEVTQRLKSRCDRWRDILTVSDDAAAEMIRKDQIDILIDLAGHTTGNRLPLFGREPAPVQVTYLGYPNTTGVEQIDYRITDDLCDPIGLTDAHHSEKLLRVSAPFITYRPPENAPDLVDPPAMRTGFVTFGSFNKAAKAGVETIALWAKVLAAVPRSRLMLKSRGLGDRGSRQRLINGFASHGIAAERLELVEANLSLREHLAAYGEVDIALDTFPYHGTTTTCEALWMGVPVISRIGQTHVSRVGLTLLAAVGLQALTASDDEGYVQAATRLAADVPRITELRRGLRARMETSPLLDSVRLTKSLEQTLWQAFASWCGDNGIGH
jgi:predicted O-linked N-acetylglucosamine transferase (SPINDLY family)